MSNKTEEETVSGQPAVHGMAGTAETSGGQPDGPTQEQIAALAYEFWIERGSPHGSHEEDWHRAEQQLLGGHQAKTKSAGA